MAISKTLPLALFLLSTLVLTAKSQDIHEILPAFGLPLGLFPDVNNQANIESNGQISLHLDSQCVVHLPLTGTQLHYNNEVTGVISFGRIENIKGIKMLLGVATCVPVTGMRYKIVEGKMQFDLGVLSEVLPMDDFKNVPPCKSVEVNLKFRGIPFAKV